jgi:hypothetical protein
VAPIPSKAVRAASIPAANEQSIETVVLTIRGSGSVARILFPRTLRKVNTITARIVIVAKPKTNPVIANIQHEPGAQNGLRVSQYAAGYGHLEHPAGGIVPANI